MGRSSHCLESHDLPQGRPRFDVAIPREITLKPRVESRGLGSITVLEGRAEARIEPAWSNALYREIPTIDPQPIRPSAHPLLRLGQSRALRDDGLDTARRLVGGLIPRRRSEARGILPGFAGIRCGDDPNEPVQRVA